MLHSIQCRMQSLNIPFFGNPKKLFKREAACEMLFPIFSIEQRTHTRNTCLIGSFQLFQFPKGLAEKICCHPKWQRREYRALRKICCLITLIKCNSNVLPWKSQDECTFLYCNYRMYHHAPLKLNALLLYLRMCCAYKISSLVNRKGNQS